MKDKQKLLRSPSKAKKSYLPDEKLKYSPANYSFRMFNVWSVQLKYSCRNTKTNGHPPSIVIRHKLACILLFPQLIICDVIPCSLIQGCQRFGGICCFHLQFIFLSIEMGQEVPPKNGCFSTIRQPLVIFTDVANYRLSYPM